MVALFFVLYLGQDILIPIVFSLLFAILLNPFVSFLERIGINRVVAILLAIIVSICIASAIFYFIGSQFSMLTEAFPVLMARFKELFDNTVHFVQKKLHMNRFQVNEWVENLKGNSLSNAMPVINQTLTTVAAVLVVIILLPVYIFMFLFYKPLLLEFIGRLFSYRQHEQVNEVLEETKSLIQSYLIGLLVECALVAFLNTMSLLIVGLDYALLLGIIGALLNIIPYIGGIFAIGLPMLLAVATKSWSAAFLVLALYTVVQFIDNNVIVPKIVASKVKINGLVSIVVVFIGGALWGVSGMFLSIPITAIVKVIFDRIPSLSPFGYLIGDTMPPILPKLSRKISKKKD
jgi:predicted PurR-regulated permease PerM